MEAPSRQEWLIVVGLGNPGREYTRNRHNVGFHCLDRLAAAHHLDFTKKQLKAQLALGRIAGRKVILVKPQTYVNLSGEAVGAVARFYKVDAQDVLVIYDDLDLPRKTIRVRPRGGAGGHNGIKSMIKHLGTQDFARIRVGIGRPPGRMEPKDYVLQDWSDQEWHEMHEIYDRVVDAVEVFIREGVVVTMNRFSVKE